MSTTLKLTILILLVFTVSCIVWWMVLIPAFAPQQIKTDGLVKCSDYNKIVDRYMSPGPEYHVIILSRFGGSIDYTIRGEGYNYSNYQIGKYTRFPDKLAYTFEELNETETGYRNACKVISYV